MGFFNKLGRFHQGHRLRANETIDPVKILELSEFLSGDFFVRSQARGDERSIEFPSLCREGCEAKPELNVGEFFFY